MRSSISYLRILCMICCDIFNLGLGQTGAFLMYQCAERSVRSVIKCLISKVASNIKGKDKSREEIDVDNDVDGVACLCDVLEYFIQIIRKRAELFTTPPTASPSKNGHHHQQQSNQLSYNINKSSPQSSSTLLQAYLLDEVSNDSDVLHLLLSLKEISAMLTTGGNLDIIHKVLGRYALRGLEGGEGGCLALAGLKSKCTTW